MSHPPHVETYPSIQAFLLQTLAGTHRVDVAQEAIGHFRWILWMLVQEATDTQRDLSVKVSTQIVRRGRREAARDLQSFIKTHFAHQRLTDPVDEGLGLLCSFRTAAGHLQFHHFTLRVLRKKRGRAEGSHHEAAVG